MRIRKPNTHPRQAFHLWRMQLNLIRVAREILISARVSHSHIISHHQNDVWFCSANFGDRNQYKEGECKNYLHDCLKYSLVAAQCAWRIA